MIPHGLPSIGLPQLLTMFVFVLIVYGFSRLRR